ncbi:uncharacterized protein Nmag_0243 [Natrialba magadii ATCC 43099]|uniref:Uncharacterized protein n=1 Tax=Natrialba magadii (strain ATCC 43099 / DSM 3394 / CCM 3739 / CIP 104546 / IAM 13178 / JCM 8861 / NBRC 102185 / NCIMB 2190 / MS3) TaxID=547559 RepID=D3SX15_NATMM|nr:hypothetical protein [Natrialba magadii]ADD03835.1 uncharacterized protein Nmag_0243 [Natrialba magadii ATCC 43099]ELY33497.1 hypothetical protein C500_01655 [Natrialba magadii ATCC 43099]
MTGTTSDKTVDDYIAEFGDAELSRSDLSIAQEMAISPRDDAAFEATKLLLQEGGT